MKAKYLALFSVVYILGGSMPAFSDTSINVDNSTEANDPMINRHSSGHGGGGSHGGGGGNHGGGGGNHGGGGGNHGGGGGNHHGGGGGNHGGGGGNHGGGGGNHHGGGGGNHHGGGGGNHHGDGGHPNPIHFNPGHPPHGGWRGDQYYWNHRTYFIWSWGPEAPWWNWPAYYGWRLGLDYYIPEGIKCYVDNSDIAGEWVGSTVYYASDDAINAALDACESDPQVQDMGASESCRIRTCVQW